MKRKIYLSLLLFLPAVVGYGQERKTTPRVPDTRSAYTFAAASINVQLSVKVLLEGAMVNATTMNTLQVTDFGSLLPRNSPYSRAPATYGNFAGAGSISDWILVQVVDASDINNVLEEKSLLLKSNGTMVGLDGTTASATFLAQEDIRIAIRHRHHMAIFSNPIFDFAGIVAYDFTTGANKALTPAGSPVQQVSPFGGTYAMWSSDVNSDSFIDGSDLSPVQVDFNNGLFGGLFLNDVNMDGYIDGIDLGFTQKNFDKAIYGNF